MGVFPLNFTMPLVVLSRFASAHMPFPLTGRLMRSFDSIVGEPLRTVSHVAEDSSHGSGVASQFFGNDPQWFGTLAAQQPSKESFCGALITMRLNQDVNYVAVLIHRTP